MRILVTGAGGRLGSTILQQLQAQGYAVSGADVDMMDITDRASVQRTFEAVRPDLVIHCAALTAVDYCAEHPGEALRVNGLGTQTVALACQAAQAALLYVSTNEVFDGTARRGYREYDEANPSNPYGYSKWVGENAVRELVSRHYIVRTSWLFSHGGNNFVQAILKRAAEGQPLRVVINEVSSPTYSADLADAICRLIRTNHYGTYHLVNEGYTSRYGFARKVLDLAGYADTPIEPIALVEYPRASRPPEYAILHNVLAAQLGIRLRPWQDALAAFIEQERVNRS